jgi:hypothetical protein
MTLVVNSQLFAGVNAIVRIGDNFQPNLGGACVFAAALGHLCQLTARLRQDFLGQSNRQGLCARTEGAIFRASPLQKSR